MFLIDNNLSFRIASILRTTDEGIIHVSDLRLESKDDHSIWEGENYLSKIGH